MKKKQWVLVRLNLELKNDQQMYIGIMIVRVKNELIIYLNYNDHIDFHCER